MSDDANRDNKAASIAGHLAAARLALGELEAAGVDVESIAWDEAAECGERAFARLRAIGAEARRSKGEATDTDIPRR